MRAAVTLVLVAVVLTVLAVLIDLLDVEGVRKGEDAVTALALGTHEWHRPPLLVVMTVTYVRPAVTMPEAMPLLFTRIMAVIPFSYTA